VGASVRPASPAADEFWFVRRGSAHVTVGGRGHDVNAGDVVYVPRSSTAQTAPGAGRFEYVAVRIFPAGRSLRTGIGAGPQPRPMPDVATKAQIDSTLSTADKNVTLHSSGAVLINHVIYKGAPGPWEVHETCDDLYFVRMGTARAQLDGTLIDGKEDPPGEIRGTGVHGAREAEIAPGDMVFIPRNTAHFMNPGATRLGYLLVKVCD
jgi:mannose-6-phosphate isomerase-like protein (cupin superfamily)